METRQGQTKQMTEKWGIIYNCPKCGEVIKLPATPNADVDKYERLVHLIYSARANNKEPCLDCSKFGGKK